MILVSKPLDEIMGQYEGGVYCVLFMLSIQVPRKIGRQRLWGITHGDRQ